MKKKLATISAVVAIGCIVLFTLAQGPPPPRLHKVIQKGTLTPRPATATPDQKNEVSIEIVGDQRIIKSNGIPNHKTGVFPNSGNPNRISAQSHTYSISAKPEIAATPTPMHGMFGVAINGVPFDPGAGEFYDGAPGWQYEPLSGAIDLGIDVSHAHVQPTGKYHYHGLPMGLLDSVKLDPSKHSPLIGWAADGFPMYAVYGYSDPNDATSKVQKLTSSYQLKQGDRPGGAAPGGRYDGTFVADYEYVAGSGDLDECCGRFTITPDFPEGTYAYFLTEAWPVVPRMYRGTPSADFRHGPGGGGPLGRFAGGLGGRGPTGSEGVGGPANGPGDMRGPGGPGRGGPPRPGQILPNFVQDELNLSDEQKQKIEALQKNVDEELRNILTKEQLEQLKSPPGFRPGGGAPGERGQRPSRPR
ncbi:MAG: YHYH protein [Planctomycetales bacterium]|nr:YHYH protein [Planctomycetales bacterium]